MEELKLLDDRKLTKKVYNKTGITLGAFFGGPIGAGYFLIENYKSLDKRELVNKAWGITIISTVFYYIVAYLMETVLNTTTIPLYIVCLSGTRQIFKQIQEADVEAYIQQGGEVYSNWRTVGISLLFLIGTVVIIGTMVFLFDTKEPVSLPRPVEVVEEVSLPARSTTSSRNNITQSVVASLEAKSYGDAAHVIVYNNFFFSESKIDSIAEQLTVLDFFDANNKKEVYIEKILFDYEFSIVDVNADLKDEKTNLRYEALRSNMERFLNDGKVFFLLKDENLEEVLARFGEDI